MATRSYVLSFHSRRAALEEMRLKIEEEMIQLDQKELYVRRRQANQKQLKPVSREDETTLPTMTSSSCCSINNSSATSFAERCKACSRKDQIIHEKLNEIRLLRKQLKLALENKQNDTTVKQSEVADSATTPEKSSNRGSWTSSNYASYQEIASSEYFPIREVVFENSSIVSNVTESTDYFKQDQDFRKISCNSSNDDSPLTQNNQPFQSPLSEIICDDSSVASDITQSTRFSIKITELRSKITRNMIYGHKIN